MVSEDKKIVCNCMNVKRSEIIAAIREHKLESADDVQDYTDAGTVCGKCMDEIEEIVESQKKLA